MKRGLVFIFLISIFLISACGARAADFKNIPLEPAKPAPEIALKDQSGNPLSLQAQRGKPVVLVFGFTNCPSECPLTLAHIKVALETLGADASSSVSVVMVTTDPVRDTPKAIKDYLGAFNPAYIGIPGTAGQIAQIWEAFGVEVLDGGETHSSTSYIIDKKGNLRLAFNPETEPSDIASDLKILLAE